MDRSEKWKNRPFFCCRVTQKECCGRFPKRWVDPWASMNIKRISQGRGWSLGVYEYQEDFPREGLIPGRLWISRRFPKGGVDPWASMNIKRISLGRSWSLGVYEYQKDFPREVLHSFICFSFFSQINQYIHQKRFSRYNLKFSFWIVILKTLNRNKKRNLCETFTIIQNLSKPFVHEQTKSFT